MAYQMMFAIITPALISGAFAERLQVSAYVLFTLLWATFIYDPLAHWMWADGGWLQKRAARLAGAWSVHVSSAARRGVRLVLGKRLGYPRERILPHT